MKKIFVVPDNDAEALAIINMVKRNDFPCIIMHEDWGAASWDKLTDSQFLKLEQYANNGYEIYGVELKGEAPFETAINIDHHNYGEDNRFRSETSIEQVSEILGCELTTFEQFVSANDKGYIFEMKKLGEEIGLSVEEIGSLIDRVNDYEYLAKGVSEADISTVRNAISNAYIYDERMIVVDLDDFSHQRICTNELYSLNKYRDTGYGTIVVNSIDSDQNERIVVFSNQNVLDALESNFSDRSITWRGGQEDYGYYGIQIDRNSGESFENTKNEVVNVLEENILGYHRLVEKSDISESFCVKNFDSPIPTMVHRITDTECFANALMEAKNINSHGAFVTAYPASHYEDCQMFLVNSGCAGIAVTPDGDMISVFKNDLMAREDDIDKITTSLLSVAIENGGQTLDCFDGFLPRTYMQNGMMPTSRTSFDMEYAPKDWNYERDGMPDVVFMMVNEKDTSKFPLPYTVEDTRNFVEATPVFSGSDGYDMAFNHRLNLMSDKEVDLNMSKEFSMLVESDDANFVSKLQEIQTLHFEETGTYVSCVVRPGQIDYDKDVGLIEICESRAVYNNSWGCPTSGEFCYNLNVNISDDNTAQRYSEFVESLQQELSQSTVSISTRELGDGVVNYDFNIGVNSGYDTEILAAGYNGDFSELVAKHLSSAGLDEMIIFESDDSMESSIKTVYATANPAFVQDMDFWAKEAVEIIDETGFRVLDVEVRDVEFTYSELSKINEKETNTDVDLEI